MPLFRVSTPVVVVPDLLGSVNAIGDEKTEGAHYL
jgi:hypothetical protein